MEGILKGLLQWIYGLFLDLLTYCANALLGIMNTDLTFFETSVPVVVTLYKVFVAVGWGLLIGNLAFQALKIMFSGMGFETEPPAILLIRTTLFGVLLVFSQDVCEIGLSLGKNVIDLIGVPSEIKLSLPTVDLFTGTSASWLLVIIIGFILGFQLIKLFFEIGERYVIVGVLTLLCPVGLSMGGSKSTKDICNGYIRTYASMIVMMVMNVLFLKLILSALATMPTGTLVLPWCLLVVGIAKTARKADDLLMKIGMSPSRTGDPLGNGGGKMLTYLAMRSIMNSAVKGTAPKNGTGIKGGSGNQKGGKGGNAKPTSSASHGGTGGKGNPNHGKNGNGNGGNPRQNNQQNNSQSNSQNNPSNSRQNNRSNANQNNRSSSHGSFNSNSSTTNQGGNHSSQTFSGGSGGSKGKTNGTSQNGKGQHGFNPNSSGKNGKPGGGQKKGNNPQQNQKKNSPQKNRFGNNPNFKHNPNPLDTKPKPNPPTRFGKQNSKPVDVNAEKTEKTPGGETDEQ